MSHVLLFTCIRQALAKKGGTVPCDRRFLIALQCYMEHLEAGRLIWGPLLAWAYLMGDKYCLYGPEKKPYLMPFRDGVHRDYYPWQQHGALTVLVEAIVVHGSSEPSPLNIISEWVLQASLAKTAQEPQ